MEYEECHVEKLRSKFDCLLFDLDDTLYPKSSGLAKACTKNIEDYLVERLGVEEDKVLEFGNLLYKNYGTTLAGLRAVGYNIDYNDYHSFVHGKLPYENLKPDPILRNILLSLPIRKVIFTNSDMDHAVKALRRLRLEDCFEGIVCFESLNPTAEPPVHEVGSPSPISGDIFDIFGHFSDPSNAALALPNTPVVCKPSDHAMDHALRFIKVDPKRTMFFDDSVRNIQSGKRLNLHTVLVGSSEKAKCADHVLESIQNLREAIPELWEVEVTAGGGPERDICEGLTKFVSCFM